MVEFAQSPHNQAQAEYERQLGMAKASNQEARAARRQSLEDCLVQDGIEAVMEYEALLDRRAQNARCLAEYDGISIGRAIAARARCRIQKQQEVK